MNDIRELERDSIRNFVQWSGDNGYLKGMVLDYGCGTQPYKEIVLNSGGHYDGYDRVDLPGNVSERDYGSRPYLSLARYDTLLVTQVIQYIPDPREWLKAFRLILAEHGYLVMTGPTSWPTVEAWDFWRFTLAGIRKLLDQSMFKVIHAEARGNFSYGQDSRWYLGWGVVCQKA